MTSIQEILESWQISINEKFKFSNLEAMLSLTAHYRGLLSKAAIALISNNN